MGKGKHNHKAEAEAEVKEAKGKRRKHAGRSILELFWEQLDMIVERMMSEAEAADGLDAGRAQGITVCIAIILNPYEPNMPAVKEEAMRRWEEAHGEETEAGESGESESE